MDDEPGAADPATPTDTPDATVATGLPPQWTPLQEALRRTAVALRRADVPFALVGGYAAWARGAPEPVHDADVAVAEEDVGRARDALTAAGLAIAHVTEDWLVKVVHEGEVVDVIHRFVGRPMTADVLARADEVEVLAIRMPVLPATEILSAKLRVLGEHYCDLTGLLPTARALREQVDWPRLSDEVADHPYARAFLHLAHELGVSPVGPGPLREAVPPGA
jgi:hypothetical protein